MIDSLVVNVSRIVVLNLVKQNGSQDSSLVILSLQSCDLTVLVVNLEQIRLKTWTIAENGVGRLTMLPTFKSIIFLR
jgi:hypothetical protein